MHSVLEAPALHSSPLPPLHTHLPEATPRTACKEGGNRVVCSQPPSYNLAADKPSETYLVSDGLHSLLV
jgi:hypothetical protein